MKKEVREHIFPLSLSQQNIWNLEKTLPGTSVNNICTTVRIRGNVDFFLLQESINRVLEMDSSLRTRLTEAEQGYCQYHVPYVREDFPVYDFSDTSREGIENWENAVTREPMQLMDAPLYRFVLFRDGETSGGVLVKLHHIIADGWSQIAICNKIGQTYLELLEGKTVSLTPAPDYELYVQDEQNYLKSKAFQRDEKYWRQVVEASAEPSVIKNVSSAAVSPVGRRMSFELPQILNHAIYSYCQAKRVAPFAVFYMALAIYFKRIGGAHRFTIGVPIFNRSSFQFKQSTGMFVTTLPFYNEIDDEWSLNQFNEHLMDTWYEMLRHQRYPFEKIAELAGGDGRLFHVALSYQDSKIYESKNTSVMLSGRWHYCGYQAEQLTIHLTNLWNHRQYAVDYDYLAQYFTEEEIRSLHSNLCDILNEALTEQDKPIYSLRVLSMEQKEALLYTNNRTDRYLEEIALYDSLVKKCREYQNRVAVICRGERTTYGALLYKSSGYACAIASCGTQPDELVVLVMPRTAELLAAMVGTLQAGCGYLILSEELPLERIRKILEQSNARVLITTESMERRIGACGISVLRAEEIAESGEVFYIRPEEHANSELPLEKRLAYVVYTSGSTGEPKGVEITHRNLLNLAQEMKDIYGQGAVLSVCNVGFDAFMLESIVALLNGRTIVLPSEEELESPERLAALIKGHAVGFFSMTPSRLSAYLQNKAFSRAMRKLESVVCGGEAFPAELLKKLRRCCNARIYNQYGPSETTVGVSLKELSHADRITAGRPMGNCRLYVLDKWMNPLPAGGYGNLYIGGKCVGRGYRNRPELTAKVFTESPFVADETIYFTGDVASWTQDGEILLRGRMDHQVKLRGLRVELQEVSSCIESYPGVEAAVAVIRELGGQQVLGVYYCAAQDISEPHLMAHAATYLPKYMLPSFLMRMEALPVSANGKVVEKELPLPSMQEGNAVHLSKTAEEVLRVFQKVLKRTDLNGSSDYFLAGGNSLNAMECIMELEESLGRRMRIADLYALRTAVAVAAYLEPASGAEAAENAAAKVTDVRKQVLQKAPQQSSYQLSPMQQGMYIQSLLDPAGVSYNMPGVFKLSDKPQEDRLQRAFVLLIQEEPLLRTSFVQEGNGVRAKVQEQVEFQIEQLEASDFDGACKAFLKAFDLGKAPLLRAALWQSAEEEWYLFLDSHHIIGDGMSTPILMNRLNQAYCSGQLQTEWNYYDYLYSRLQDTQAQEKQQELIWWEEHLQELPEKLILPADELRPKKFRYQGSEYECALTEQESAAYDRFCAENGISGYVLFLAAYGVLLSEISGREDFVIGAPVAGRMMSGTDQICGPFINTLPLRLKPERNLAVHSWLERVQAEVNDMLDHQQVSLEEIITKLQLPRGEQNALYQVMLTQSPVDESSFMLQDQKLQYLQMSTGAVKMDLITEMKRRGNAYVLHFSYASDLFYEETIRFYGRCMRQILRELSVRRDCSLQELRTMCSADYEKYVDVPNYSMTPFVNLPIHKLMAHKVRSMEDQTAVIFHHEKITYGQLERRAAAIAQYLEAQGAEPGQCVGLCLSRTPDMIAAMYGVLKAGCAYVFMLPSFPAARLHYMLEISEAAILFYDASAAERLPEGFLEGELSCTAHELPTGEADGYVDRPVRDDRLVNVLFTSGSTGQPKGVMLRHRSISNLYAQMKTLLDPIEGTVLCSTNSVFDCFVVETLIALALGRTVVLADEEEMMLPWKLAELVDTYETGIFEMTPSRLQMCLGNEAFCRAAHRIKIVLLGGEVVTRQLSEQFYRYSNGVLMNMYGPTEATVFTTMGAIEPGRHITIGKPLYNTRTYVLDENRRPVLPTACGEMYIAGECLAAGYISRPELTESSFVEDIYFPGEKMYRSGDLVRLRLDGSYDYVGRKDNQVKLNGQRVELSEITGAILETAGVKQAAVVPVRKDDGSMELCAFYEAIEGDALKEEILAHLKQILPVYMIPSRLTAMAQIPVTATNKIDMQALIRLSVQEGQEIPESQVTEKQSEADQAADLKVTKESETINVTQSDLGEDSQTKEIRISADYVLSVWNKVLSVPVHDPEASFFAKGGTSMAALNVLSLFFNDHFEMTLSDFYENATAGAQAEFLLEKYGEAEMALPIQGEEALIAPLQEKQENEITVEWSLGQEAASRMRQTQAALVTGGTGFFGAHLVKALLQEHRQVICLMRDGDLKRLQKCLIGYFGKEFVQKHREYLKVVKGDIAQSHLGMEERDYVLLASRVGEIYHCAADVRHYAAEEDSYLKTNVDGTANVIEFARLSGNVLYHMSTCSVSGELLRDGGEARDFTEKDYDIGQIWEENIYVKSKFLAEGLVLKAAKEGLHAKIFRLGRLVGRASDGMFQKNPQSNAFYLLVNGFCRIGAIPRTAVRTEIDLMPVDVAVEEVMALRDGKGMIYHIMHQTPPALGEVLRQLQEDIAFVSEEEFMQIMEEKAGEMDPRLHGMVMNNWQIFKNALPVIRITNTLTMKHLAEAGMHPQIPAPGQILKEFC